MLARLLAFELKFWMRGMMVWIFFLIIAVMFGAAMSTDKVTIGGALRNTDKNAPFVIEQFYFFASVLTLLMTTAFVNSAAARDFAYNTHQILFSTPIKKFDFLVARYVGSVIVSVIPMLGVSAAALVCKYMPWVDAERWGPVRWDAHAMGILVAAIPNTIFIGAILFAIAALTRSTLLSFLGGIFLLVALSISDSLLTDLSNENWSIMLDPFGGNAFAKMTKYWTPADKNHLAIGFEGWLLWNRLLWVSVGLAVFAFAYFRFSFAERSGKVKKLVESAIETAPALPKVTFAHGASASFAQFWGSFRFELKALIKSTQFIVIGAFALINVGFSLALSASEGYGNSTYPVTYWVLQLIAGSLYSFIIAILVFYAGNLVWKEREDRVDEIHDTLPYADWISYASKFCALTCSLLAILAIAGLGGLVMQTAKGFYRYQFGLYTSELFFIDASLFLLLGCLAFLFHVLAPNKYIGYFAFITFLIVNAFVWRPLNVGTLMVRYASRPSIVYSDLYGRAPFWAGWSWFSAYWALAGVLVAVLSILFWRRGKEASWAERVRVAQQRFHGALRPVTMAVLLGFAATGAWAYYNTEMLNKVQGPKDNERRRADYEKTYKQYEKAPLPRVTAVKYDIAIYPETRNMTMKGEATLVNKTSQPIEDLYFSMDESYDQDLQMDGMKLVKNDERLNFRIYKTSPAMQPGESRLLRFTSKTHTTGFENEVSNTSVVQNGTFFNNTVAPALGYQAGGELSEKNDRKEYGLKEKETMPALERNCTEHCGSTYLDKYSDWVSVETTISTSPDQIAVAPGSLLKEWTDNGRRYFQYKLDRDSLNFYSFMSARYKVARDEWNGVKTEVYYHPEHEWNVPKMTASIKKTLDYASKNFGPYAHKQARIIEFPRVARFAQAFPGTMPYSEGIGFIANLNHPDDIDMVYYVVAHEMGHQWWAHQVVGANMQGATLLSETMAQYTALMVMEHEYGRDMMRKFLKYEMDNYLRSRGTELLKERPLLQVEAQQGYVHYRKGSVVMYYLKEMIGEEAINRALRKIIAKWAYQGPPYPTSHELVDAFTEETPPELRYLIKDLFEDITLFSNRTTAATAKKRADGKFDVTIETESHKYKADAKGNETESPLNDWIEVGAFAKPEKGKKYGKTLYRQRFQLNAGPRTFTFVTDEAPEEAGIDPFALLIDRVPDDNVKKITVSQ